MSVALRNLTFIGLLLCFFTKSYASTEPYENFIKGTIKKGDSLMVKDEKFRNPVFNWAEITNIKVQNSISLRVLSEQAISQSFSCAMKLQVSYFSSPEQVIPTIDTITLNVNYNKTYGASYQYLDHKDFTNGYEVKVKVLDVNSPEFGTQMPPVLQLNANIVIERKYLFKPHLFIGINGQLSSSPKAGAAMRSLSGGSVNASNQLVLTWDNVVGEEEYDIEWVIVDSLSEVYGKVDTLFRSLGSYAPAQLAGIFRNNATRITTNKQDYNISLLFNADYIFVRMRQVSYNSIGLREEGEWSYVKTDSDYAIWELNWHEKDLNWQYAVTYAEEGKKKEVVSYFDGTLRSRQTATLNNTDAIAVVQENVYDQFGRAVASILPTPVKVGNGNPEHLHYFKGFNLNTAGKSFSFKDLKLNDTLCLTLPQPLDSMSLYGAARYYSSKNKFLEDAAYVGLNPFVKYTPNAFGYPYSLTKFTADNTGRPKIQGGVGQTFQPGATGDHTTKYFYDKPLQEELDKLFGNDVGDAIHYLKNTVIDPNGQASISYLNASGKTIATALIGATPANVQSLPGKPAVVKDTVNLIKASQFKFDASSLKLTATTTYTTVLQDTIYLKYNIENLISRYPDGAWKPCSNCYYDLSIVVKNDCNKEVYKNVGTTHFGSKVSDCNFVANIDTALRVPLEKMGEYYISFTLALSDTVIQNYTKAFIDAGQINGEIKKKKVFIDRFLNSSKFIECFNDCKTARMMLGTKPQFTSMFKAHLDSLKENSTNYTLQIDSIYESLLVKVGNLESTCISAPTPCDVYEIPMRLDVSPGGQYAMVDSTGTLLELSTNVIELYFKNGAFNTILDTANATYKANLITREDGSVTSPYAAGFTRADLIKYWQSEWAAQFLSFHPEYCKLEFCRSNAGSVAWDDRLKGTNKASNVNAVAGVAYTRTSPTWLLANDPFFLSTGQGHLYADSLAADLTNYSLKVLKLTSFSTKNLSQYVDFSLYCSDTNASTNSSTNPAIWDNCLPKDSCRVENREWALYRDIYLELKEKYFQKVRQAQCHSCEIGAKPVLPSTACTNILTLGVTGVQTAPNQFVESNYSANLKTTYTFLSGSADVNPNLTGLCSTATPVFYDCIKVTFSGTTVQLYNVWKITCTEAIATCEVTGVLYATSNLGGNVFAQTGSGYSYIYTFQTGYSSTNPPTAYCNGNTVSPSFYECYTVWCAGVQTNYYNVWVSVCNNYNQNPCDVELPQFMESAIVANTQTVNQTQSKSSGGNTNLVVPPPCEEYVELMAAKTSNEQIAASYYDQSIYSIKTTEKLKGKQAKTPSTKNRFTPYAFKERFVLQNGPGNFIIRNNVWVANLIPDSNSVNGKQAKILAKMASGKNTAAKGTASKSGGSTTMSLGFGSAMCTTLSDDDFGNYNIDCMGSSYTNWNRRTTILLHDGSGNPVVATSPVVVTVSYGSAVSVGGGGSTGGTFSIPITIPIGQSSGHYDYTSVSYADEGVASYCIATTTGINCIESITGSSFCEETTLCGGSEGGNPCPTILLSKISRFNNLVPGGTVTATESELDAKTKGEAASFLNEICDQNAVNWVNRLDTASISASNEILLAQKFAEICKKGGDIQRPTGSSSIAPGQSPVMVGSTPCYNFGDVIKAVLGITTFTNGINPWLIDDVYPYDVVHEATPTVISNTNAAICAKLSSLNPSSLSNSAFYAQLQSSYGAAMTLSFAQFEILLKGCSNCKYLLSEDLTLPVFLTPGAQGCIDINSYNTAMTALNTAFGSTLSSSWTNYETIVSNYLNHKFGFSFGYDRYQQFAAAGTGLLCNEPPFSGVEEDPYACAKTLISIAHANGEADYEVYITEEKNKFRNAYVSKCASAQVNVSTIVKKQTYHYTLYYYDAAGNLVRTVPPEGVSALNKEEIALVAKAREKQAIVCNYNGPDTAAVKDGALQKLSNVLTSGTNALEFWMYTQNTGGRQFIAHTPDWKYMVQVCANGNLLNVDIFSLNQTSASNVSITLSNHVTANVGAALLYAPWTHVVVQGAGLATGSLQIWVNGIQYSPVAGAPSAGCAWGINGNPVTMPVNMANLKHLRIYEGRLMTGTEILANARSSCFAAYNLANLYWYRFNLPTEGGPTALAANTTQETQYNGVYPAHGLTTTYAYNSTNQVTQQHTPDAGKSLFWYDYKSRLVVSQNAKQQLLNNFSFTKYDTLGRITEVGLKNTIDTSMHQSYYMTDAKYLSFLAANQGNDTELTQTVYDAQPAATGGIASGFTLNNLRKRVAASIYRETRSNNNINASYYSYDVTGNVKTLYQQVYGLGLKQLDYEYDLHSGKVNFLAYQHGAANNDRFYYQYEYDAENRLMKAFSGTQATVVSYGVGSKINEPNLRQDAFYKYYLHGPLARVELGEEEYQVQGSDYAYTLQGWLKGVNGSGLNRDTDMGGDGKGVSNMAKDVLAYSLGYYSGDFAPIGGSAANAFNLNYQQSGNDISGKGLFNGNISSSTYGIAKIDSVSTPMRYTYGYDQLNRLKVMRQHNITGLWNDGSGNTAYGETFSYDGNGNILSLSRNKAGGAGMDQLAYGYNYTNGKLVNNRLNYVRDDNTTSNETGELKGQANYGYDAIGNLISDSNEGLNNIDWNVYGKIKQIYKATGNISYGYDPSGNRVSKALNGLSTYYVRDAQGNNLAVYEKTGSTIKWKEQGLYGSSRLGMWKPNFPLISDSAAYKWGNLSLKQYELANHLGNVMVVLNGYRGLVGGELSATIVSSQDFYSFGSQMPQRKWGLAYRYGFNGKENDNDVKGEGNQQDYGMRIYDPRIGKFLSVDPITSKYPELTPYQFASNTPIEAIDLDGLESASINAYMTSLSRQRDAALKTGNAKRAAEIKAKIETQAMGHIIMADNLLTRGAITKFFTAATFFSAFNDNAAKTQDGRELQNKESWKYAGDAFLMYTSEIAFTRIFNVALPLLKSSIKFSRGVSTTFAEYEGQQLGYYSYSADKGLELDLYIPKNLQGKGLGTKIFETAINTTKTDKFTAKWITSVEYETGSSVNLQTFYNSLKNKLTESEAAFSTWSGKQAKAAGFNNVEVKRIGNGIEATFTKTP
ncbi:hypothetical protein EZ428_21575 [Pedobacter frigiditerrae]|uniref:RHS repeat-associated core domain-containing protein n=1 Tax=Pedobacter frigiditerrae TaxID=2530452 RepID=A0A4R0MKV3_9SPHI|nr:RHS repeat-associated core domain-containing protein [Pedobacter frigiditerrae]TCC87295.1 hypothetical protein EZ428_21575 [Pedobacter frigiditerrae]